MLRLPSAAGICTLLPHSSSGVAALGWLVRYPWRPSHRGTVAATLLAGCLPLPRQQNRGCHPAVLEPAPRAAGVGRDYGGAGSRRPGCRRPCPWRSYRCAGCCGSCSCRAARPAAVLGATAGSLAAAGGWRGGACRRGGGTGCSGGTSGCAARWRRGRARDRVWPDGGSSRGSGRARGHAG